MGTAEGRAVVGVGPAPGSTVVPPSCGGTAAGPAGAWVSEVGTSAVVGTVAGDGDDPTEPPPPGKVPVAGSTAIGAGGTATGGTSGAVGERLSEPGRHGSGKGPEQLVGPASHRGLVGQTRRRVPGGEVSAVS